jgi:malate dehydrogenase
MAEAILKDQGRILPCAAMLQGEYGVKGLFVGVLCKLGGNGMEQVIEVKLNDEEKGMLANSTKAVQELVDALAKL